MGNSLVLSIFPGIDLLGRAFEEEGYCVVRGPDLLWGGDIRAFHPSAGVFEGVIGGPPCQRWSRLVHMVRNNGYRVAPDLIPEFERVVAEARPNWWLMENVPAAPEPAVTSYQVQHFVFDNHWTGAEQGRVRRFSFGDPTGHRLNPEIVALESPIRKHAVLAKGGGRPVPVAVVRVAPGKHRRKSAADGGAGVSTGLTKTPHLRHLPSLAGGVFPIDAVCGVWLVKETPRRLPERCLPLCKRCLKYIESQKS